MSLTDLRHLNLSYNSLTIDLLQFCSEHFFSESLETLILVNVEEDEEKDGVFGASSLLLQEWLIENLPRLTNLITLDVSENQSIMVDELLASLQLIQLEDLRTLTAAHCSCTEEP